MTKGWTKDKPEITFRFSSVMVVMISYHSLVSIVLMALTWIGNILLTEVGSPRTSRTLSHWSR